MKKLFILALLLSPMAMAQSPLDAGTVTCGDCSDYTAKFFFVRAGVMDNINCNGYGHSMDPAPLCPLWDGRKVTVDVVHNGITTATHFSARQVSNTAWELDSAPPPISAETYRVYFEPVCMGVFTDTFTYLEAQSVEGGITFTIFMEPEDPQPGLCWNLAVIGEDSDSI